MLFSDPCSLLLFPQDQRRSRKHAHVQLTIYALALARRANLPLKNFKCAWFDEKDYFEFFPLKEVLYCFFVISCDRRRILHVNVTKHPTSGWIIPQLREAFPFEASHKYLIFDRDPKFGIEVMAAEATRIIPKQTSFRSPWKNGIAERWVGGCRRDLLDQIIAINERHLKRVLCEYVSYHQEDRTHLGLGKGTTNGRSRDKASGCILSQERLGGLHHRYDRAA